MPLASTRSRLSVVLQQFGAAREGAVAVLFALMLIPLLLATGAAVDFARLEILRTSLQSVADSAALAGASALSLSAESTDAVTVATDYFNKGVTSLATATAVGIPTVTVPSAIEVTVTATARLQYSFMSLIGTGLTVTIVASAEGPAYALQVTKTGGFTSSAYDSDSIYFYAVPSSGTVPTSTSSMTLLFTNDPAVDANYQTDNANTKSIKIGGNDTVGFALVNRTGGITAYGHNGYGAAQGSTHYFYSSTTVPSATAYPSQNDFYTGTTSSSRWDSKTTCSRTTITTTVISYVSTSSSSCNAHPCTTLSGGVVLENNLLVAGSCSTQATASQTCLQLYENPVSFSWNDMGGGSDDFDYNDADYTVSCVPSSTTAQPTAVILVQ